MKEQLQDSQAEIKNYNKTLEAEKSDLVFLATQKDKKIADLEAQVLQMRDKLNQAL